MSTMTIKGLKRGDTVFVIAGKDKGKSGKIAAVLSGGSKVVVEGLNTIKRHQKARRAGEKGSVIQMAMPLDASNVLLKCAKCGEATRKAIKLASDGKKMRSCKKCGHEF